jgi:aminoglycoside phosphotransferase (APT) family kinase protein
MTGRTPRATAVLGDRHALPPSDRHVDLHAQHALVVEALDAARTGPALAVALGEDPGTPCLVADAKYEPGRTATVLYRLGVGLVHVTVPAPGGVAEGEALLPNGIGVRRFPIDPGLPSLSTVLDPARFGAALGQALGLPDGSPVATRLLRYRPGRRATLLVSVGGVSAGPAGSATYVAKVYHDDVKAAAVATEGRALQALRLPPPLVLAPVVAHLPDLAVVVQRHLPGRDLVIDLADPMVGTRHGTDVTRAAQALAALHRGTVPAGRPRPVERELRRFVDRATAIRSVDPVTGDVLLALAHDVLGLRPAPGPVSLVHGDCKPSQFLMDRDRVALLDLDHCGIAEPAYDVGNFVASLRQAAVRASGSGGVPAREATRAAEALGATFVTAYLDSARPARAQELTARIRYYAVVSMVRKALRAWARSPVSSLPRQLADDARKAVDELGRADGRH